MFFLSLIYQSFFLTGTLITEWNDGYKICEEFLASESSYQAVADQMVKITQFYRFDGWLINIENKIVVIIFQKQLQIFLYDSKN